MVPSTERYLHHFAAAADRRRGTEPDWLSNLRERAIAEFEETGLPTPRDEDFKHTPVSRILDRDVEIRDGEVPDRIPAGIPDLGPDVVRIVLVDGRLWPDPDLAGSLPDGVRISSIAEGFRDAGDGVPEWLGRVADFESRGLTALNTAYMADGALVVLERGTDLERPVHIVHATTPAAAGRALYVRNLVVALPGSRGKVVEHWVGGDADTVVNAVTEIAVEDGARIDHVKLEEEGPRTDHFSSVDVIVRRDGRFDHHLIAVGGRTGRTETRVRLAGEGAECDLMGVYLGRDEQLLDQLTLVTHEVPHGTSRQVYKGILDGKARGIFNGLVLVREGAQKTDAFQSNKNLVLSETAEAHTRPQLDISADDVKCAHGSTVGALDTDSLFYLRSRGIGPEEARRLLIRAFASDILAALDEGPVRKLAEAIVKEWLER